MVLEYGFGLADPVGLAILGDRHFRCQGDGLEHIIDGLFVVDTDGERLGGAGFTKVDVNLVDVFNGFHNLRELLVVEHKDMVGLEFVLFHLGIGQHR